MLLWPEWLPAASGLASAPRRLTLRRLRNQNPCHGAVWLEAWKRFYLCLDCASETYAQQSNCLLVPSSLYGLHATTATPSPSLPVRRSSAPSLPLIRCRAFRSIKYIPSELIFSDRTWVGLRTSLTTPHSGYVCHLVVLLARADVTQVSDTVPSHEELYGLRLTSLCRYASFLL